MFKICQKCNHPNPSATGAELEACPECGAIYSRVAQAMAAKAAPAAPASARPDFADSRTAARPAGAAAASPSGSDVHGFAERLRAASLYPTFRGLVRLIYFVWMVLAAVALIGAVTALLSGSGIARIGGFLGGLFFALFFAVIAKVTREAALMLADLSDAAVHIAAGMKP